MLTNYEFNDTVTNRNHLMRFCNLWGLTILKITSKGRRTYDLKFHRSSHVERKAFGEIANDFISIGYIDKTTKTLRIYKDRISYWTSTYELPPLSLRTIEELVFPADCIYLDDEGLHLDPFPRRLVEIDKPNYPMYSLMGSYQPDDSETLFLKAVQTRIEEAYSVAKKNLKAKYSLHFEHSWVNGKEIKQICETADIWPVILFDICNVSDKYLIKECPYCGALYFPVNGLTHCLYCKPMYKSSLQTKDVNEMKRLARIKQLQRKKLSYDEINDILRIEGIKTVRSRKPNGHYSPAR